MNNYATTFAKELIKINEGIAEAKEGLVHFPADQRLYMDVEREYRIIEGTYNALLSKQAETLIRLATSSSNLTVIDPAKNLGQSTYRTEC